MLALLASGLVRAAGPPSPYLSPAEVLDRVVEQVPSLQGCVDAGALESGSIQVEVELDPAGAFVEPTFGPEPEDATVRGCLAEGIAGWRTRPHAEAPVRVRFRLGLVGGRLHPPLTLDFEEPAAAWPFLFLPPGLDPEVRASVYAAITDAVGADEPRAP